MFLPIYQIIGTSLYLPNTDDLINAIKTFKFMYVCMCMYVCMQDEYEERITSLGGFSIPLNIFLYQEVQRMQAAIAKVSTYVCMYVCMYV